MPIFRVTMEAGNLPAADQPGVVLGFFATRYCTEADSNAAQALALAAVREEFCGIFKQAAEAGLDPWIEVETTVAIAHSLEHSPTAGATWFAMDVDG